MIDLRYIVSVLLLAFCATTSAQVPLRIVSELGKGQVWESDKIIIGNQIGTIELNAKVRSAYIDFNLPSPGSYHFSIEASMKFEKNWFPSEGKASGILIIHGGEIMSLIMPNGRTEALTLTQIGVLYGYQQPIQPMLPSIPPPIYNPPINPPPIIERSGAETSECLLNCRSENSRCLDDCPKDLIFICGNHCTEMTRICIDRC